MTPHSLIAPGRRIGHAILRAQSDERLVEMAGAGSEPAFEAIVARYRRPLQRYCARIVGDPRAEDVVQDAIVRAYVALGRGEQVRTLKPWLYRIAHNTALNHLRDRSGTDTPLDDRLPGGEGPQQAIERREGLQDAVAAVSALPIRQRDAIVLRELEGRSYDEIAGELGVSRGAARQLLSRARTSVRAGLTALIPAGPLMRLAPLADGPAAARLADIGGASSVPKLCAVALTAGAIAAGATELPPLDREPASPRPPSAEGSASGERAQATPAAAATTRVASSTSTPKRATAGSTRTSTRSTPRAANGSSDAAERALLRRIRDRAVGDGRLDSARPGSDRVRTRSGAPQPATRQPAAGGHDAPATAPAPKPPPTGPGPGGQFSTTRSHDGGLRLPR